MNLEQRVQALEQEVALLKGQIQATLLDIQEQMLKHAYPALQGEQEAPDSPNTRDAQSLKVMTAKPAPAEQPENYAAGMPSVAPVAAPVVRQISANAPYEPEEEFDEPVYAPPMPRPNKGASARQMPQAAYPTREFEPEIVEPVQQPVQRGRAIPTVPTDRDWIELEKWVAHKVEQLGVTRTQELIDFYAEQARFTAEERDMLLEFTSLYDDSREHGIHPDNGFAPTQTPSPVTKPTIVPRTREVVDEIRAELRQRETMPQSPLPQQPPMDEINDSQLLVLRLIAGILNAGEDEATERPTRARNGRRRG
ncbi:MAG: hypothetical protein IT320_23165 [Anaerolineae bacterium]|nr:hypothetical protein [Anaerolineae bacterium]